MKGYVFLALAAMGAFAAPAEAVTTAKYHAWVFKSGPLQTGYLDGAKWVGSGTPIYSTLYVFTPNSASALAKACPNGRCDIPSVSFGPGGSIDFTTTYFPWTLVTIIGGVTHTYSHQTVFTWNGLNVGGTTLGAAVNLNADGTNIDPASGYDFFLAAWLPIPGVVDAPAFLDVSNGVYQFGNFYNYDPVYVGKVASYYDPEVTLGPDGSVLGSIPEPSTWAMMGLGFASLGFAGWRNRRAATAV